MKRICPKADMCAVEDCRHHSPHFDNIATCPLNGNPSVCVPVPEQRTAGRERKKQRMNGITIVSKGEERQFVPEEKKGLTWEQFTFILAENVSHEIISRFYSNNNRE